MERECKNTLGSELGGKRDREEHISRLGLAVGHEAVAVGTVFFEVVVGPADGAAVVAAGGDVYDAGA